jgi:sugar O-acyltransferase (sialic acid O-acetyltransferase NeuD family)
MTSFAVTKMVLWGATGHARVLRECMGGHGVSLVALFDNNVDVPSPFDGVPIYYGRSGFDLWLGAQTNPSEIGFLVAIGGDRGRDRVDLQQALEAAGLHSLSARHASAFIAESAVLGAGAQVLANATVCVDVTLGRGVIVNTAASVDHECIVGDGAHIGPGARLAGCVSVGRYAMIGTAAVVLPRIRIGEGAVVGAGAVVLRDIEPGRVVVGNPARPARVRS